MLFVDVAQAYYTPGLGRFINRDPYYERGENAPFITTAPEMGFGVSFGDGLNLYWYVMNDPVDLVDPFGLKCKCCCCCARNIRIENIKLLPDSHTHWGHSFDTVIDLEYIEGGSKEGLTDCTFEWFEKTDLPAIAGHQSNVWTDMTKLPGSAASFNASWGARKKACPGKETVRDTDTPGLAKRPGRNAQRTLYFAVRGTGGQSEECAKACGDYAVDLKTGKVVAGRWTIYATQFLTVVNGKGDKGSFRLGIDHGQAGFEPMP